MIKSSLEWTSIEIDLIRKSRTLVNGHEVLKMIGNIRQEITQLSKAEVEVRRGNKHAADELLIRINNDIDMVKDYLLVAALLG